MRNRLTGFTLAAVLALPATAQQTDLVSRDLYQDRLRNEGNSISFCYNSAGMTSEFDQALARTLGAALLAEVRLETVLPGDLQQMPLSYDYRIPLALDQIFLLLVEHCDAYVGFLVNDLNPEWIALTRPYLVARTVMFTADPDAASLDTVDGADTGMRIGVRLSAPGDTQLINYLGTRSSSQPVWTRVPYHDNRLVLDRVVDGTNDVGMMWSPGFWNAVQTDPAYAGLRELPVPFPVRDIPLGIATRAQDTYLNSLLSEAIAALEADGTIAALLEEHHLAPASGG